MFETAACEIKNIVTSWHSQISFQSLSKQGSRNVTFADNKEIQQLRDQSSTRLDFVIRSCLVSSGIYQQMALAICIL